jgi:hypothetical protein
VAVVVAASAVAVLVKRIWGEAETVPEKRLAKQLLMDVSHR